MREENGFGSGSILMSFLLGGLVGAGLALLFAPKSGSDTRQMIKEFAGDVKDKTQHYVEDVKGKVSSGIDKGKGLYQEKKSMISSAFEAGKDAYTKEKEKMSKETPEENA
jgi:gas vesicle protein